MDTRILTDACPPLLTQVAAQLSAMRDENARMWEQLAAERRKVEKLVGVVGRLWDIVGVRFPGTGPYFPPSPRCAVHLTHLCSAPVPNGPP